MYDHNKVIIHDSLSFTLITTYLQKTMEKQDKS